MQIPVLSFALLGIVLSAQASASILASFALEMDQDPVSLGWTVVQGPAAASHSVAGGILAINSPEFYVILAPESLRQGLSFTEGWTAQARFRIVSGPPALGQSIFIKDSLYTHRLDIGTAELRLYGGSGTPDYVVPFTIGTDFHTYRIDVIENHTRVWVDGQNVFDIHQSDSTGGSDELSFGDAAMGFATVSEWDYFRVSSPVPEPASLGGIMLMTACCAARRRRR